MTLSIHAARTTEGAPLRLSSDTRTAFVQRHAVLSYYVLTFAISWGAVLCIIGGPAAIPGTPDQFARLVPVVILAMLLGPSIASLALTGAVDGRAGYRRLAASLLRWRLGLGWYAVALFVAPAVYLATALGLWLTSPVFVPAVATATDRTSFVVLGIAPVLLVGVLEEIGWTGFVTPRLRLGHGVFATALIIGLLWGAWHLLTNDLWGGAPNAGDLPVGVYLALNGLVMVIGQLPAYRLLMVWAYGHTSSLLLVVLMHASLLFSTFVLSPSVTGAASVAYTVALGVVMWAAAAAALGLESSAHRRPYPKEAYA